MLKKQFGGDSFEELYSYIRIATQINRLSRRRPFLPQFRHPPPPSSNGGGQRRLSPSPSAQGAFLQGPLGAFTCCLSLSVQPCYVGPYSLSSKRAPLDTSLSLSLLQSRGNTSCLWKGGERGGDKVSQQQPLFHSASVSGDRIVGRRRGSELILSGKKIPNARDRWRPRPAVLNTTTREREKERATCTHTQTPLGEILWVYS